MVLCLSPSRHVARRWSRLKLFLELLHMSWPHFASVHIKWTQKSPYSQRGPASRSDCVCSSEVLVFKSLWLSVSSIQWQQKTQQTLHIQELLPSVQLQNHRKKASWGKQSKQICKKTERGCKPRNPMTPPVTQPL